MNNKKLAILLATYNGEKYLRQQIDSILNQSCSDYMLYIRDDNSIDSTKKIIKEYVLKYPEKIKEIQDNKIANGARNNFLLLLKHVYELKKYSLFMFCDQDDVWQKNKIELTINEYNKVIDKNIPILIHTDLYVVDKNLNMINKSFIQYSKLRKDYINFNNYLIQNNVTGCTVCINEKLVDLINFDIKYVIMHDWFFALIASAFGQVIFIDRSTIYYRQHGQNVVGAKKVSIYNRLIKNNTIKKDINNLFIQADSFRKIYYDLLTKENKKIIDAFCEIKNSNKLMKLKIIKKYKFYKQGFMRLVGEFVFI